MIKGYINKAHLRIADFVFKHIMEGRKSYHDPDNRPIYSGHDVRHVLQGHGWVFEEHLTLNGKGLNDE